MSNIIISEGTQAIDLTVVDPVLAEQAAEYELEQALIERAHPDPEDQMLHRHGECDGSCVRADNGFPVSIHRC